MELSEKSQNVQEMFNKIAPRYDLLNRLLSARQDVRWRRTLVRELPHVENDAGVLLDVACGTGDVLLEACKKRTDFSTLNGLDISSGMMQQGAQRADLKAAIAARGGHATLHFTLGSAEHLPQKNESVHAVSIAFGLRNVDNRTRALQEFFRVLRPGGRLLVLEFFEPKGTFMSTAFRVYFKHILPVIGGVLSDRAAYRYLPDSVVTMPPAPEFLQQLTAAGFQDCVQKAAWLDGAARLFLANKPAPR